MRGLAAPLMVVVARARRSRTWVLPALALAVVVGAAGALASESVILADQGSRAQLSGLGAIDRAVRLVWEGPLTPYAVRTADRVFARLGIRRPTEVLLLNPVRLSDAIVHPVAVDPLGRWLPGSATGRLGRCRPADCPVLQGSPGRVPRTLSAAGVRMRVVGRVALSPTVLGYSPSAVGDWPVVLTGDVTGLNAIPGLDGVYRTYTWMAPLPLAYLHSWSVGRLEARLLAEQAALSQQARFNLEAPFFSLDAARRQAGVAVHRLLLVDGGVVVILILFVLLAASALQREQRAELERLRQAGGRPGQAAAFVLAEAGWIAGASVLSGLGLAIGLSALLAGGAGEPVGAVLDHGLISWPAAAALAGGWALMTALLAVAPILAGRRLLDMAALAGAGVLVAGLTLDVASSPAWVGLLVPLVCLSAGLVLSRATGVVLRALERISRRGSLDLRLALIGLERARGIGALAVSFLAISVGLAGFGLAFRATLIRGAADQAADHVPLDALVSAGSTLDSPLQLAPLARWQALSHGSVFPVRRTQASYPSGEGTQDVPVLGVPAAALPLIHGWRSSDGPAPLAGLAARLRPPGPARTPGPVLPPSARWVELGVRSPNLDLDVTLDLRSPQGTVDRLALGETGLAPRILRARAPSGHWEVEAIELSELSGTAITNGHQNGENPAPATQYSARLTLGPLLSRDGRGHLVMRHSLGSWRAVGAASGAVAGSGHSPTTAVVFQSTGWPGVLRPRQPSDSRTLPVLVDPGTAAAAGPGGRIGLTIDGFPVRARVVGVLRRFPTIAAGAAGFVVADQALLSGALDAQLPGQGRPDELWISTTRPGALRAAMRSGRLAGLNAAFRSDVEHGLRSEPVASGVMRTLLASGLGATILALLGMLLVLAGPFRQPALQVDLEAQGVGPAGLRRELRLRLATAALLGIWPGLLLSLLLDRLTVSALGGYESGTSQPPLITVVPALQLLALGAVVSALCVACGWVISGVLVPKRRRRGRGPGRGRRTGWPRSSPADRLAKELVR
jgi:hypothetical protein